MTSYGTKPNANGSVVADKVKLPAVLKSENAATDFQYIMTMPSFDMKENKDSRREEILRKPLESTIQGILVLDSKFKKKSPTRNDFFGKPIKRHGKRHHVTFRDIIIGSSLFDTYGEKKNREEDMKTEETTKANKAACGCIMF